MLRSLVSASEKLYTCLVIPRSPTILQKGPCMFVRSFHISQWREDRPIDRSSLRQMEPDKVSAAEDASTSTEEVKPGSLYPTADTHSMLIGGVRFDELPIIHIKATRNNTIVSVTKHSGDVLARSSGGMEGFKNARKGTNIAAQAAGISAGQKALGKEVKTVRVCVRGLGPGRLPALRGLQMAGVNIVSITDTTRIQQHGPRPRKQRRL